MLLVALVLVTISSDETESPALPVTDEATSRADEPAAAAPPPATLQDPLRATDLPPPTTRAPAPEPDTKSKTRPLRPPAEPFVK